MDAFFFWLFAALMLGFAVAVVLNRNPVASALSLVVSFVFLAALFFMLDAYFIGIIEILVYAGAVMVLFLFVIMLLDLKAEERRKFNIVTLIGGALCGLAGLQLSLGSLTLFSENMTAGRGWIAVAAVMLGRARPLYVAAACVLFGLSDALGLRLQGEGLPNQITDSAPYLVTLAALVIAGLRQRRPSGAMA